MGSLDDFVVLEMPCLEQNSASFSCVGILNTVKETDYFAHGNIRIIMQQTTGELRF